MDVSHTDEIAVAYLQFAQALGAKQQSDAALNVDVLVSAARQSAEHASADAKPLAQAVLRASEMMVGKPIADQRRAFLDVSNAVVALLDRSAQSAKVAPELYVAHCPMAFNDAGATWLQKTKLIANPYYATAMKSCGAVQRTIAAKK